MTYMKRILLMRRCHTHSLRERRVVYFATPSEAEASKSHEREKPQGEKPEEQGIEPQKETTQKVDQAQKITSDLQQKKRSREIKGKVVEKPVVSSGVKESVSTPSAPRRETQQEKRARILAEGKAQGDLMRKFNTYMPQDSWEYLQHLKEEEKSLLTPDKVGRVGTGYFPDVYRARLALVQEMIKVQEEIIRVYERAVNIHGAALPQQRASMGIIRALPDRHIAITNTRDPSLLAAAFGGKQHISFEEFRRWQPENLPEGQKSFFERHLRVQYDYANLQQSITSKINAHRDSPFYPFREQYRQVQTSLYKIWEETQKIKNENARIEQMELILADTDPNSIRAEIIAFTNAAGRRANEEAQSAIARYNAIANRLAQVTDVLYAVEFTLVQVAGGPPAAIASSVAYNYAKLYYKEISAEQCALFIVLDAVLACIPVGAIAQNVVGKCCEKQAVQALMGPYISTVLSKLGAQSATKEGVGIVVTESITHYLLKIAADKTLKSILLREVKSELGFGT